MATPKKKPEDKLKVGRKSSFKPEYVKLAYNYALLGADDNDLARYFDTTPQTINNWKHDFPEFFDALKEGKDKADSAVAKSLYKRAIGYKYTETTYEDIEERVDHPDGTFTYEPKTKVKTVYKQQAPDTTAQIFWLKNRQPKKWRDKTEVEHAGTIDVSQTQFKINRRKAQ